MRHHKDDDFILSKLGSTKRYKYTLTVKGLSDHVTGILLAENDGEALAKVKDMVTSFKKRMYDDAKTGNYLRRKRVKG